MISMVRGERTNGVTCIPAIISGATQADAVTGALADALAKALADALADDSVKASVNSMGTGSGSVGSVQLTVALHAHSVRPVATHSGQYVAKVFELFDAISTRR